MAICYPGAMTQLIERKSASDAVPADRQIVVVRLGEIVLKKKNRPMFVRQLARNIRRATRGLGVEDVALMPNRIFLTPGPQTDWPELRDRLRRVFGVKNFSLCDVLPWDADLIQAEVLRRAAARRFESFRIDVQRSDKRFPGTSQELERSLGLAVKTQSGARVDLERPEAVFHVEIQPGGAYVHDERIEGAAGLPAGVSGRVVVLLSGGIDSPVAAWRMIGRGCIATFVHFMSFPYLDASSRDKAIALVRSLTRWQYESRLHVVSFGDVQHQIVAACPPKLRVVLYRRFMVRIAQAIARREHAGALVTGESLGQVSSQTLSNIATIDAAVSMPVLRPLIGRDKDEIVEEARRIETFNISIEPDQDCCTLFVPPHPATSTRIDEVEAAEQALDIDGLVALALEHTETLTFRWPELPSPPTPLPRAGEGTPPLTPDPSPKPGEGS
jgi:thiamine biosynthesis protein ThiI